MIRTFLGVDVCKDFLDAHVRPADLRKRFDNSPTGIEQLVLWVRSFAPERIVFESTGPYQKAAVGALLTADLPAVVVNARQVRDFESESASQLMVSKGRFRPALARSTILAPPLPFSIATMIAVLTANPRMNVMSTLGR